MEKARNICGAVAGGLWDLDGVITRASGRMGEMVGTHPWHFVTIPLFLTLILASGLTKMDFQTDPEFLFVPENAPGFRERSVVESLFPVDFQNYVVGRETRVTPRLDVLLTPKEVNSSDVIGTLFWKKAKAIDDVITNLTVRHPVGLNLTFQDVCAKQQRRSQRRCVGNDFLDLVSFLDAPDFRLQYPVTLDEAAGRRYPLPAHLGGLGLEEDDVNDTATIKSASAIRLSFVLDPSAVGVAVWEESALRLALKVKVDGVDISAVSSQSISQELVHNVHTGLTYLEHTLAALVTFAVATTMDEGKSYAAVAAVVNTLMAVGSAWGLAAFVGVPWQAINMAGLFLLVGVGMDDAFILLAAWKRSQRFRKVEERLRDTYMEAIASITISSVTNLASFAVGAFSPGFQSVKIFCLYTGSGIVFVYLWTLTFFGACLAYSGRLEEQKRHHLFFCFKPATSSCFKWISSLFSGKSKSSSKMKMSKANSVNTLTNLDVGDWSRPNSVAAAVAANGDCSDANNGLMQTLIGDLLPRLLSKLTVKIGVALALCGYWAFSTYGLLMINEGLERQNLALKSSYSAAFYDHEDRLFRLNPYRFQIVISNRLNYADLEVRLKVEDMLATFKRCPYIENSEVFTENWLQMFDRALELKEEFNGRISLANESAFVEQLVDLSTNHKQVVDLSDYVVLDPARTRVLASRFFLQSDRIKDAMQEMHMITKLREIAANQAAKNGLNVTIYHPYNLYWDQFLQVRPTAVKVVALSVLVVFAATFLLLPRRHRLTASLWVALVIVSVELGVLGSMYYFGINLDVVSMICLAICVGVSVDFSAHIAYHYLSSAAAAAPTQRGFADTRCHADSALHASLSAIGVPVMQAAASTVLCVSFLTCLDSYILSSFAIMMCTVVLFGAVHGLVLLPVLLSTFTAKNQFIQQQTGAWCCKRAKKRRVLVAESVATTTGFEPATSSDDQPPNSSAAVNFSNLQTVGSYRQLISAESWEALPMTSLERLRGSCDSLPMTSLEHLRGSCDSLPLTSHLRCRTPTISSPILISKTSHFATTQIMVRSTPTTPVKVKTPPAGDVTSDTPTNQSSNERFI